MNCVHSLYIKGVKFNLYFPTTSVATVRSMNGRIIAAQVVKIFLPTLASALQREKKYKYSSASMCFSTHCPPPLPSAAQVTVQDRGGSRQVVYKSGAIVILSNVHRTVDAVSLPPRPAQMHERTRTDCAIALGKLAQYEPSYFRLSSPMAVFTNATY